MKKVLYSVLSGWIFLYVLSFSWGVAGQMEISDVPSGLVAYYPLNGSANDASGLEHHGTIYGATFVASRWGEVNGALRFDGLDDYVRVPAHADFNLEAWTIAAFIMIESVPVNDMVTLIAKMDYPDIYYNFAFMLDTSGQASAQYETCDSEFDHSVPSDPLATNQWYFLAGTRSASGVHSVHVFYWGQHVFGNSDNWPGDVPCALDRPFHIGGSTLTGVARYFGGKIDDVLVFDRALSFSELTSLARSEPPIPVEQKSWGNIKALYH